MKTTGRGNESLMIVVPVVVLLAAVTLAAGGPRELMNLVERTLTGSWELIVSMAREVF